MTPPPHPPKTDPPDTPRPTPRPPTDQPPTNPDRGTSIVRSIDLPKKFGGPIRRRQHSGENKIPTDVGGNFQRTPTDPPTPHPHPHPPTPPGGWGGPGGLSPTVPPTPTPSPRPTPRCCCDVVEVVINLHKVATLKVQKIFSDKSLGVMEFQYIGEIQWRSFDQVLRATWADFGHVRNRSR